MFCCLTYWFVLLSSFDEYSAEVKSGRLEWSPCHRSDKFWVRWLAVQYTCIVLTCRCSCTMWFKPAEVHLCIVWQSVYCGDICGWSLPYMQICAIPCTDICMCYWTTNLIHCHISHYLFTPPSSHKPLLQRENVMRLNDKRHEILRMLVAILEESQNPTAIAVASHDLGEYVRYYPRGKKWWVQ